MTKILLAEDDDSMRGFLAAALRRAGHDVQDYADGEGALQALVSSVEPGEVAQTRRNLLAAVQSPGLEGLPGVGLIRRRSGVVAQEG